MEDSPNQKIPVFVSSTSLDLEEYRRVILKLLHILGFDIHGMEDFGSRTESPLETCISEVEKCKIFLGIYGMRWGSIDDKTGKAFIELEYETAIENSEYILLYLIDEDKEVRIALKYVDIGENGEKLKEFKDRIKKRHTISKFDSSKDLEIKIERDISRLLRGKNLRGQIPKQIIPVAEMAITAEGSATYYLGEKISLSGSAPNTKKVFLFLTGPNLNPSGVKLDDIEIISLTGNYGTFTEVDVREDGTWIYIWDTSKISKIRESGDYTIYLSSEPRNKDSIESDKYSKITITLRQHFLVAAIDSGTVAKGDPLTIRGIAEGNVNNVYIWILGQKYRLLQKPVNVQADSTYEYILSRDFTKKIDSGQYFVLIQHPGPNKLPDVRVSSPGESTDMIFKDARSVGEGIKIFQISDLRALDAVGKLNELLNFPDVDDVYSRLSFIIEDPFISINEIGPKYVGDAFSITGSTNLAEGDELNIEIFYTDDITQDGIPKNGKSPIINGITRIVRGTTHNFWSFDVSPPLSSGDFIIIVTSIETNTRQNGELKIHL
jgi:hypothetical protein